MYSFYNKLLRIDLNQQSHKVENIADDILEQNLGGKGLAAHLLLEFNPPRVDPLSPENNLIFLNGPFTGSSIWGSCRVGAFTKSPQTGFFSESYSGGTLAEYVAASGIDGVIVQGAANEPLWIEIGNETVSFHSADDLLGLSWGQK